MDINSLLVKRSCSCAKEHDCDIKYVFVEPDAAKRLPEICREYESILLVADENTYAAAGRQVEKYIGEKIRARKIFSGKSILIPNEDAIKALRDELSGCGLIVGIASGVIQDLCKYVSFFDRIPYYIVATAPSMDGYASTGAAMITDGMKVTYSAKAPDAIIADTSVLKNAPLEMIKAGYGDIIGKYSALNDWKLARTVFGEYFCEYVYNLTSDMLKKTLPLAKKLLERDEESVKTLMEALIVVGVAMSFAGSSRPASGSEHHLSHYFEITGIVDNEEYLPHGIDVGFSTVITSKIREKLLNTDFPDKAFTMPREKYERELRRVYGSVAEGCIALQDGLGRYDEDRLSSYLKNEREIKEILREAPSADEVEKALSKAELFMPQFYASYSGEKIRDAVRYAKDLKDRYTVLWMYYDIFGLEDI